jgi:hypothetical protein
VQSDATIALGLLLCSDRHAEFSTSAGFSSTVTV